MLKRLVTILLMTGIICLFVDKTQAIANVVIYNIPDVASFCGERVPIENKRVAELFEEAFLGSVYFQSRTILWIKKSNRYFPYVEQKLRERNLPDDLKYVLVAESSFRHDAVSTSKAIGPWQFMEATAKQMGLRVDKSIDERRNFERSTDAALDYLTKLYSLFNNWTLAVASYNCGENRMMTNMKEQGVNDYYNLDLPVETESYIFRILTAKTILSHPEQYGYYIATHDRYQAEGFDSVEIRSNNEISIKKIATLCETTLKEIMEMNPELKTSILPAGEYRIKAPKG
ncbi:MAG: lytic transglycosylase domain-containing protein, partial [Deltaproteobacteria bacterium]